MLDIPIKLIFGV